MTSRPTVLIAEDDSPTRCILGTLAEHQQFFPLEAGDGAEALRLLNRNKPDLIILDLLLPRVSGFEILRHMKCTSPRLLQRTIVITAATDETLRHCVELASVWVLRRKPLLLRELAADLAACQSHEAVASHHQLTLT